MNNLLTTKQPIFELGPQNFSQTLLFRSFHHKNQSLIFFPPERSCFNIKVITPCSATASNSLSYNGWDYQSVGKSTLSGDSNLLHSYLISLGINDNKYLVVYFLGFICALTIFRVKVSSIVAFPACVLVFAVGFSVGFLNGGQIRWNPTKKMTKDLNFKQFGDKFKELINECHVKIAGLRNDVRKAVEYKHITYDDLESILKAVESIDCSTMDARNALEGYIESIVNVNDKKKKEVGEHGFNIVQFVFSLFQEKSNNPSKSKDISKKTSIKMEVNEGKKGNILSSSAEDRTVDSLLNRYGEETDESLSDEMFDTHSRTRYRDQSFTFSSRKMNQVQEPEDFLTGKTRFHASQGRFDSKYHGYHKTRSSWKIDRSMEVETQSSRSYDGLLESVDLGARVDDHKMGFSYWQDQETNDLKMEDRFESTDKTHHHAFESFTKHQKVSCDSEPSLDDTESMPFSEDIEFDRSLSEAKSLLQEAKEHIMQLHDDRIAENALYSSTTLLSRAISIRPMSLIAIGLLGNTYLLHGELKLRISRELRSVLAKINPTVGDEWDESVGKRRDKIISVLVNVCEECEELLIKAGRKYKLALSIDGNDMRALYNWGLALFFRAQLIADVGPGGAHDADKVFLAAIDKFDAMISRSNLYAPDALFRWGAALEQRSRLRPRKSKEKVKLLQQARRLYKDALDMDSDNIKVKDALSSAASQLKTWE